MRLMIVAFAVLYCGYGFAAEQTNSDPQTQSTTFRSLGYIGSLFVFSYDALAAEESELQLTLDETLALQRAERQLRTEKDVISLMEKVRSWNIGPRPSDDDYFRDGFQAEKDTVDKLNKRVLSAIDDVLKDGKRRRRCRQLMSLGAIRFGHAEEFLRLNDLDTSYEEFLALMSTTPSAGENEGLYEVACRYLVEKGTISDKDLLVAGGDVFAHALVSEGRADLSGKPLAHVYQDVQQRMLLQPKVQTELKITLSQVKKIVEFNKEFNARMHEDDAQVLVLSAMAFSDEMPEEKMNKEMQKVESILAEWRRLQNARVAEILDAQQLIRFKQLLFQYYTRRLNLPWALWAAGKAKLEPSLGRPYETGDGIWPGSSMIKVEVGYTVQGNTLNTNLERFYNVLGERKVAFRTGEVVLSPVAGSRQLGKPIDAKLRNRIRRTTLKTQSESIENRNRRREPQVRKAR